MRKNEEKPILFKIADIYRQTPYGQEYLSLLVRRGKIEGEKIGGIWYIALDSLKQYLEEQGKVLKSQTIGSEAQSSKLKAERSNFKPSAFSLKLLARYLRGPIPALAVAVFILLGIIIFLLLRR
ncbi:MAG: hypothetical protein HY459_01130 [Parcubacteria group bacterium]|nr:hypothetical protein [Parcubacteria group bacterium]